MTKTEAREALITRYVRKGGNEQTGRERLAEVERTFSPLTMASALMYVLGATESLADRATEALA